MLMVREGAKWRFFVIPRLRLDELHRHYLDAERPGPGRPPKRDEESDTDALQLSISLHDGPSAWNASLGEFFELWPAEIPELLDGPGSA